MMDEKVMEDIRRIIESMVREIKREDMPQVTQDDVPDAIKLLRKDTKVTLTKTPLKSLKAIQDNVSKEKVVKILKAFEKLGPQEWPRIFVSEDGYIVDGHHRWLAYAKRYGADSSIPSYTIHENKAKALALFNKIEDKV